MFQTETYELYVTDGWWWTEAQVDSSLMNLIKCGKIRDGCKLVVFSAAFTAPVETAGGSAERHDPGSGKSSVGGNVLTLNINSTRKAVKNAKLGYIHREDAHYLNRGLHPMSLKHTGATATDGRNTNTNSNALGVYGISGKVLYISPTFYKVKLNLGSGATNGPNLP